MQLGGEVMNIYSIINKAIDIDPNDKDGYIYFLISGLRLLCRTDNKSTQQNSTTQERYDFDKYNFICDVKDMDAIESVYIHALTPKFNGKARLWGSV